MKNIPLQICDATIYPGESLTLALPLPEMYSCVPMYMPIQVVHGRQQGPCLLVIAAMHGDEINGTEIIHRLLKLSLLKRLRGTLIAVPALNVYGLTTRTRYIPAGMLLDRSFPGSETGSHAERLVFLFTKQILDKAQYCINLQTGALNHSNLPHIYVNFDWPEIKALAQAFQAPVIVNTPVEVGSLRETAQQKNIPVLVYEAGEALRFDERAIRVGIRGIVNIMRKLGMLPKTTHKHVKFESFVADRCHWVTAPCSGIAQDTIKLGAQVKAGNNLAIITDPFGTDKRIVVTAPLDGVVVGKNNLPLVYEGETLFQIAVFDKVTDVSSKLEQWQKHQDEKSDQLERDHE